MKFNISKFILNSLVFLALIGMVFLLMTVNTKLLNFLNWIKTEDGVWDKIILTGAGLSFALGSLSVILWYNPKMPNKIGLKRRKQLIKYIGNIVLKSIFVVLDALHVYIFFNIHTDVEYMATWASPIFAIQSGLILFFLGGILEKLMNKKL